MFVSIKTKIFTSIFVSVFVLLTATSISFYFIHSLINEYIAYDKRHVETQRAINLIHLEFESCIHEWEKLLIRGRDTRELELHWQGFKASSNNVVTTTKSLIADKALTASMRSNLSKFSTLFDEMLQKYNRAFQLYTTNDFNIIATDESVKEIDIPVAILLKQMRKQLTSDILVEAKTLHRRADEFIWQIPLLLFVICIVMLVSLYYLLNKRIIKPTNQLIDNVKSLAESNFHFNVHCCSLDELGELACHIKKLKEKMSESVSQVTMVGYQVNNSFNQLKQVSDDISHGANSQFECVADIKESMENLEQISTSLTLSVAQSIAANEQVKNLTQTCISAFEENENEMESLVTEVNVATSRTIDLQKETASISDILEVINSVAEQTNLLALNAAIEAARAGDAGRGFAVVADEVRALAGKTRESTTMISNVITSLRQASDNAVFSMKSGQKLTAENAEKSASLMADLHQIFDQLDQMQKATNEVENSARQQQDISGQLHIKVETISKYSDDYLKLAEDKTLSAALSSASEELQILSVGLSENTPEDSDELF